MAGLSAPISALLPLLEEEDSAALLVHLPRLRARLSHLRAAFDPAVMHCVAVKTNPHPELLRELVSSGFGLEAASIEEVRRALAAGCPSSRLIFDSPVKTRSEIAEVSQLEGTLVNANSLSELERFSNPLRCQLGLRINPQTETGAPALFSVSQNESKFGVPIPERAAIIEAALRSPVSALHMHSGSQMRDLAAQRAALVSLASLAREINAALRNAGIRRQIRTIDIGGGLCTEPLSEESRMHEYGALVSGVSELRGFQIVTEFGQWVHAECGIALSRVEYLLPGAPPKLFIHLGADFFMRDAYTDPRTFPLSLWSADGIAREVYTSRYDIAGPLCFAGDYLARQVPLPEAQEGDWLCVDHTGANCYGLWSRHCSRSVPAIWAWDDGSLQRWSSRRQIDF
ncbi:MAG: diaminopimelate decarboxylase [Myxococcota bacterium]|nr:diaminopimelate decarboxylase [Myxococcota bacterium]